MGHSFALTRPCLRGSPGSLGHAAQTLCPLGLPSVSQPAHHGDGDAPATMPVLLVLNGDIELNDNFSQSCFGGVMKIGGKLGRTGPLEILHHCGLTSVISLYSNIIFYILIPMIANDFIIICFPKGHKE